MSTKLPKKRKNGEKCAKILTLSIANAYYKMRTTKYLSRNLENNNYGEEIYYIDVDLTLYDSIIFLHGSSDGSTLNTQTVDISLTANKNNGFYVTDKIKVDDNKEKYQFGTYNR